MDQTNKEYTGLYTLNDCPKCLFATEKHHLEYSDAVVVDYDKGPKHCTVTWLNKKFCSSLNNQTKSKISLISSPKIMLKYPNLVKMSLKSHIFQESLHYFQKIWAFAPKSLHFSSFDPLSLCPGLSNHAQSGQSHYV